ncbi:MAG: UDP-N-acetylmuramate dehydrogenase [candidate division SR1 bacterium]|nr:UDP-N-acetylmuramate dehydrogenase [candidate division SR1 bacterium]
MHIQENVSLKKYNTFQIDAKAAFFAEVQHTEDIHYLISNEVWIRYPHLILGGGANILFTKDYAGLVVKVSLLGKHIIEEKDSIVYVNVSAGEDWHETMMRMLEQKLVGCENLVYIPGTVGSAPVGNIGAYGKEAKDIIFSVEGIDLISGETKVLSNAECAFDYRDSVFKHDLKGRFLITSVIFKLQKETPEYQPDVEYKDIQQAIASQALEKVSGLELANIIIELRKKKLPDRHDVGTAGSFFKNPIVDKSDYDNLLQKYPELIGWPTDELRMIKLSAGQLIDLAELKGYREGYVGISEKHALVLINYGGGTGPNMVKLAKTIQKKVLSQFGIRLEPEVLFV